MVSLFPQLFVYQEVAPLILRVVLGLVFIVHGYAKFKGFSGIAEWLGSIGFKPGKFWAFVLLATEFFGGILLVIGLFTQLAAGLIAIIMLVAIFKVNLNKGFKGGYELDLVLLAIAVALLFLGPGLYAIDLPL